MSAPVTESGKLMTFPRGGIHPPEQKITQDQPIQACPLPQEAVVLLAQHIGAPAELQVKVGDQVKVGTLIGKAPGLISANIHSPVSGKVKKIEPRTDASGYPKTAVLITVDGDEWEDSVHESKDFPWNGRPLKRDIQASPEEIRTALANGGIVGMGGAAFPTNVKYMVPPGKTPEYLIINGVECEPYLTADHRVMLELADEVMVGTEILRIALGVEKAIIGIEANKPDALSLMEKKAQDYPNISVQGLVVKYPQGAEKQLVRAITGREVPSGKLPLDVGCVVNNVGTAQAAYLAVQYNRPFIDRVLTVTGTGLSNPGNFLVRLGTPIQQVIELAGGLPEGTGKIILGGPMMGKATGSLDTPVAKGTSGILLLDQKQAKRAAVQPCIRCSRCVGVCPMGLEPYILSELARQNRYSEAESRGIMDCVECGSCSYTCPSHRDLVDWIRYGKARIMANRRKGKA